MKTTTFVAIKPLRVLMLFALYGILSPAYSADADGDNPLKKEESAEQTLFVTA